VLVLGGVLVLRFGIWCLGFPAAAGAGAVPQLQRVPLGETLVVAAVGAEAGQEEVHPAVELELLGDDAERRRTLMVARRG